MVRLLPFALLLALLAPTAAAHVETFSQARALQAGPYLAYLEPSPTPPFANGTVSFSVLVSSAENGGILAKVPGSILIAGPGGYSARMNLTPDGTGYLIASTVVPNPGMHSVRLFLRNTTTDETHSADTELEIFPNLPFRIRAVDQAQDIVTNTTIPIAVEVVDAVTLARTDAVADLRVRLEHWSDDHTRLLGSEDVTPSRAGTGVWKFEQRFREPGMYHIRFASAGGAFNYADVPLLHVYATEPPPAEDNETPSVGVALLVGLLVVAGALRRRG